MKKFIHIIVLSAVSLSFAACSGFLTKSPETDLSPDSYFKSEKELELWTNRFYLLLEDADDCGSLCADDHISNTLNAVQKGTRSINDKSWDGAWDYLRYINYFFEKDSNCTNESIKAKYEGVAHFFRAYFYFLKVRKFGDVPYYDHVINSDDSESLNKARDSRGFVMKKVMEDLDKAYEELPESWDVYHVTKYAAAALKSRAALYEGSFRKYHKIADEQLDGGATISADWFFNQAIDGALKVMNSKKFSMYNKNSMNLVPGQNTPYREYFILEDAESSETILGMNYTTTTTVRHRIQFEAKSGHHSATRRMVNHYLLSDGNPIQSRSGWETESYFDQFQNRDPRLAQSIQGPGYIGYLTKSGSAYVGSVESMDFSRTNNGYRIIKFISTGDFENADTSTSDYPVFRYAEVLLNYAEALAELGKLTQEDIDKSIKLIRDRVGMPNLTLPSEPDKLMKEYYPNASGTQLAAILEIRRERAVELFSEGFRQWDLLRWKEGKWITPAGNSGYKGIYVEGLGEFDMDKDGVMDVLFWKDTKPGTISSSIQAANQLQVGKDVYLSDGTKGYIVKDQAETYSWNETRDYLWPIPQDQISLTQGVLKQNSGY